MLILTLAGSSNRFFTQGYDVVKYKLLINRKTIIENILNYIPESLKLLIILNKKFNDKIFFDNLLKRKKYSNYKIVEISETQGQLETIYNGIIESRNFIVKDEPITIFNGDTIRKLSNWENFHGDGSIETFVSEGNHWSFVDKIGNVNLVAEKKRISNFCSTGLYYFKKSNYILDNFFIYKEQCKESELYVAPFYNFLIKQNKQITSYLVDKNNFILCGTPNEYEFALKLNHDKNY